MLKLLKNPIATVFEDLIRNTTAELFLASPFVKFDIASRITSAKKSEVALSFLTNFKLASLYRRSIDLEALKILGQAPKTLIRSHQKLHAKTYIFDSRLAIVTSGNLTQAGLNENYEYGVLIEEADTVKQVRKDFSTLFENREETSPLTAEILEDAYSILSKIPPEKARPEFREAEKELRQRIEELEIYEGGTESIVQGLSGWKRSVFQILNEISKSTFDLDEVYAFENKLAKEYPDNKFIKDKIRQQLQVLRDLGLVEFLERGKYRKLWR